MKARNLDKALKLKQKLITRGKGIPGTNEGRDGDLTIRVVSGRGIFLFYKWGNKWYSTRMSMYTPKSSESKQRVKVPIGVEPIAKGELALTTDNKLVLRKGKTTRNQVLSINNSKTIDSDEIILSRDKASGSADASDFKIINIGTGRSYLHIQTSDAAGDPYILLSYNVVGESPALKQWAIGMDNSDTDKLHFLYKSSGTAPLTPSSTTSNEHKMLLDTSGNLTTLGTITSSAGECSGTGALDAANGVDNRISTFTDANSLNGEANLTFDGTGLKIAEQADASADTAGYGQIWVDTATPNELAFTDDAGTAIIGIGKYHYESKICNYNSVGASAVFIPLAGYIVEQISTANNNEYVAMLAPYNGTIEKILWRSAQSQDGTLEMDIYESPDETEVPGTVTGTKDTLLDRINDDITVDVPFASMTTGVNTLTKGRIYAIKITCPSNPYDTNVIVVFKWDITS